MSRVLLLGHPVAHSLSPAMHNAAFRTLGLPHTYEALDVAPEGIAPTIDGLRRDDVLGANVTIPHKEAALRLVDEADEVSRRIGALNTVVRRGSRLVGANTDVYGFERATNDGRGASIFGGEPVLILGAGGAARACVFALAGTSEVLVANRSPERAERLAREIDVGGRRPRAVPWPRAGAPLPAPSVVNATPLGLYGEDPLRGMPLPERALVDIVPTAEETPLVTRGHRAHHVIVVDGLAMLLYQAVRSFELWTGMPAPVEAMRAALPRRV